VRKPKLLLVDDELSIRTTLSAILEMHGFEVRACADVPQGLAAINSERFDVLLSDLNIGEPGDGFTVVSAMRRTQPEAVTIIITGYPAFETALQAIRSQVDDYVVKPTKTEDLVRMIQQRLERQDRHYPPALRKVSFVLEEAKEIIIHRFATALRADRDFPAQNLSPKDLSIHLAELLDEMVVILHGGLESAIHSDASFSERHGRTRLRQGFTAPQLVEEMSIFRTIVYSVLQENLLSIDVSTVIPDMVRIGQILDARLGESLRAYLAAEGAQKTA
jgi:ActR/RegA family two-component response regulator